MKIQYTTQFKKDYRRMQRQGRNSDKLEEVIRLLLTEKPLPQHYRDHQLSGKWKQHRDCHIESDWLLIYRISRDTLYLERTGTHSELFKK